MKADVGDSLLVDDCSNRLDSDFGRGLDGDLYGDLHGRDDRIDRETKQQNE